MKQKSRPTDPRTKLARAAAYEPSGFFVLRTPLLPFEELLRFGDSLRAPAALDDDEALDAAVEADRTELRARLVALFRRPELLEALFVASPSLEERFSAWAASPASDEPRNAEAPLVRYFSRMSARPTPFGLFAGCAWGSVGGATRLDLGPRADYRRVTRLDMGYLTLLASEVGADEAVRDRVLLRPNTSLTHLGDRFRYAEWSVKKDGWMRSYCLASVAATEYLEATLARAAAGATRATLAEALVQSDPEIDLDEAEAYVDDLVTAQVLVSDLEPTVTGSDALAELAPRLRECGGDGSVAGVLEETAQAMATIDRAGLGSRPEAYRAIIDQLARLPTHVEPARVFQVDLAKTAPGATLGRNVVDEIRDGLELLVRLGGPASDPLASFRERFVERYGEREVPIGEVLDEEAGIGLDGSSGVGGDPSPLLEGLAFDGGRAGKSSWEARHALLLRKVLGALASGAREISLDRGDVASWTADGRGLPDAFATVAVVAAESSEAVGDGRFRVFLDAVAGPSGALLMGRFCHLDPQLEDWVRRHLQAEEALRPDAAFAEIVHLPEGRMGNVIFRPVLRKFEIPFLGRSGAPADRQFPLSDLRVSVSGERVVLRSASRDCEVIPRLTSAHNYMGRSLSLYRFLGLLQRQGCRGVGFSWGPLEEASFLPRVVAGRCILSLARWRVRAEQLLPLTQAKDAARYRAAQVLRHELGLPRYVSFVEGDNLLPVDFDNVLSVEAFLDASKGRGEAILRELFPSPDELVVGGPEGRFVHELIVPFVRRAEPRAVAASSSRTTEPSRVRSFQPGSEWLYAKLYTGVATADAVLQRIARPLAQHALSTEAADSWFFVRYSDPHFHVRLRLRGDPARLCELVLPRLHELTRPFLEDGRVWRVQLDTYDREIERYGGLAGCRIAERLFHADSDAVLSLLEDAEFAARPDVRWRVALLGVDRLLAAFGLDEDAKARAAARVAASFGEEFKAATRLDIDVGRKFRSERAGLEALLFGEADDDFRRVDEVLGERARRIAPLADELALLSREGQLGVPLPDLVCSYVHMFVNRILRSSHRAHERVLYDFLSRLYDSQSGARACRRTEERVSRTPGDRQPRPTRPSDREPCPRSVRGDSTKRWRPGRQRPVGARSARGAPFRPEALRHHAAGVADRPVLLATSRWASAGFWSLLAAWALAAAVLGHLRVADHASGAALLCSGIGEEPDLPPDRLLIFLPGRANGRSLIASPARVASSADATSWIVTASGGPDLVPAAARALLAPASAGAPGTWVVAAPTAGARTAATPEEDLGRCTLTTADLRVETRSLLLTLIPGVRRLVDDAV